MSRPIYIRTISHYEEISNRDLEPVVRELLKRLEARVDVFKSNIDGDLVYKIEDEFSPMPDENQSE